MITVLVGCLVEVLRSFQITYAARSISTPRVHTVPCRIRIRTASAASAPRLSPFPSLRSLSTARSHIFAQRLELPCESLRNQPSASLRGKARADGAAPSQPAPPFAAAASPPPTANASEGSRPEHRRAARRGSPSSS